MTRTPTVRVRWDHDCEAWEVAITTTPHDSVLILGWNLAIYVANKAAADGGFTAIRRSERTLA